MARRRSPARLVVALSIAAVLAIFLLYTSLAGGATPSLEPGELKGRAGQVTLSGKVVGSVQDREKARTTGMRFRLRDIEGAGSVRVFYRGSVPDLFKPDRHVYLKGELKNGTFVAQPDSLVTKCPSKYAPKGAGESSSGA